MLAGDSLRAGRGALSTVSLEELVPENHILRKIDAAVQWEVRCAPLRSCYNAGRGRPAFEPEVILAIALLRHIYHLKSLRTAAAEIRTNVAFRWFIGSPLSETIPHFSTFSANLLHRIPKDVFESSFAGAIEDIITAGILPSARLIYASPFLTEECQLYALASRYCTAFDQVSLAIPEWTEMDEDTDEDAEEEVFQLRLEWE